MTLQEEVHLLRRVPLFSKIDPARLKLLAFTSDRLVFAADDVLFEQGQAGDAAYLILSGSAKVEIDTPAGKLVVATLKEHEIVGEIAILCDVPRTATVRANGELIMLKVKKEHFLGLMVDFPKLGIQVMRELALRLTRTTAELTEARRQLATTKSA